MKNNLIKNYYKDKRNRCFILGTGPSLNDIDLNKLKNEITIGVNQICIKMIPDFIVVGDNECLLKNEHMIFNEKTINNSNFVFVRNGAGIQLPERFYINNSKVLESIIDIEYFIDDNFKTSSSTGGSIIQDVAIPLACWLGFNEIYLLGYDAGFRHFFDENGQDFNAYNLEK